MRRFFSWPFLHAAVFYLVWYLIVYAMGPSGAGEQAALLWQAAFACLCFLVLARTARSVVVLRELSYACALCFVGMLVEAVPVLGGLVSFPHTTLYLGYYPVWMIGMWFIFATSFAASMSWLVHRPLLQLVFGALGGPLSMFAASKLGAVDFPLGVASALLVIAVEWAVVMLLSCRLYRHMVLRQS